MRSAAVLLAVLPCACAIPVICLLFACSDDEGGTGAGVCEPRSLRNCDCGGQPTGVQQCDDEGNGYSTCVCPGDAGGIGDADAGDAGGDAGRDLDDPLADLSSQDSAGEPAECSNPATDCHGQLREATCDDGWLTRHRWTCDQSARCADTEIVDACHFGCAPPARGPACARLAYATEADTTGDLCVVRSLGDQMPLCIDVPGYQVTWHPGRSNTLAYTTFSEAPWVVVADLSDTERVCQQRRIGRDPPSYAAGGWRHSESERMVLFTGDAENGYHLIDWLYDPESESCLTGPIEGCPYEEGDEYSLDDRFVVFGTATEDDRYSALIRFAPGARRGDLTVQNFGEVCETRVLFQWSPVTRAGWLSSRRLLFISQGHLYAYEIGDEEPTLLVDRDNGEWSRGQFSVVDFSFDGRLFAAEATDELDEAVYFFWRPDTGEPMPWPADEENALAGPAAWPSFERFEP